ncbi:SRPBCC family protein [Bacillus alkalicellulosilyticus]|uniref:SRPBCC family protein n=1 Tax=Alkalihalobacterium alkalicellulosilyticum TaxID=1912214 RepID=UPI000996279E|nr:SRPBCC family protein [Bacillus alkalicellulosilyticus]
MKTYSHSIVVDAPIHFSYRHLNEEELVKNWNELLICYEYENPEDKDNMYPGMKYKQINQMGKKKIELEVTIIEHTPPYKSVASTEFTYGTLISTYVLGEQNGKTVITHISEVKYSKMYYRINDFFFGWLQKIMLKQTMDDLKTAIEDNYMLEKRKNEYFGVYTAK